MRPGADCLLPFSARRVFRAPAYFLERIVGCVSLVVCFLFLARRGFLTNVLGAGLFWKEWTARCFAGRFVVRRHAVFSLASHGSQHTVKVAGCTKIFAIF